MAGGKILVLEGERDLVGGDGSFAEDHPGVAAAGEVDDGGGGGAGGGAAVHNKRDLIPELIEDAHGVRALGIAGEVGRSCGDRQAKASYDGAADGCFGNTEGEVAGVRGDAQRKLRAGFDDDGEGAGPEFFGEAIEGGVELASEFVGLRDLGNQQRKGLVAGAGLEVVDAVDGVQIDRIDGETIEGIGGKGDDIAAVEAGDDGLDVVLLGLVWMNAEDLSRQNGCS